MVIQEEGCIEYFDNTDAAKGGKVGQLLTWLTKGGRGRWGNADIG